MLLRRLIRKPGPGFITGSSDNDPSGIVTYSQAGAQFGLNLLWTSFAALPLMTAVQEMSARVSMVTGEGITRLLKALYPKWLLWLFVALILFANTVNIGADLGAMAAVSHLLVPSIPFAVFAIGFTVLILALEIFVTYKTYAKILKWFAFSLVSYIITGILVTTDWFSVLRHAFIPTVSLDHEFLYGLVAIFGTTIAPYLLIWQSHEELEEKVANGKRLHPSKRRILKRELREMRVDTILGMTFSQLVTFFIMITAAMTFFRFGIRDFATAADAARALEPLAGPFAFLLFSAGIIGTGLLAIPVLSASASYAMADAFNWSNGLYKKFRDAHGFYLVITFSTLVGLVMNFIGVDPMKALIFAAVINGFVAPFIIAILLLIANEKKVMGSFCNTRASNILGGATFMLMSLAAIFLLVLK